MMLRHVSTSRTLRLLLGKQRRHGSIGRRSLVTSAQKRALDKQQLEGSNSSKKSQGTTTTTSSSSSPPTAGGGGNNTNLLIGGGLVAVVAVGGYKYYSLQQQNDTTPKEVVTTTTTTPAVVEKQAVVPEPFKEQEPAVEVVEEETPVKVVQEESKKEEEEEPKAVVDEPVMLDHHVTTMVVVPPTTQDRVTTIVVPPAQNRASPALPDTSHPMDGNRVAMEPARQRQETTEALVLTADSAAQELQSQSDVEASATLQKAHRQLRANMDESLLLDLDTKSASELKIRVVQLAAEMEERTKWEALRLKEFLAMKEKETADKYMEILQKQRIEFEALLARRLLEQEEQLTRQANAAMQEKENSIQAVIKASTDAQDEEHAADLKSTQERMERELNAKYETQYETKLANTKASFEQELTQKVQELQELSNKLGQLEASLEASKAFESGSQHAHRVTAAAMAFASKLETDKGAAPEMAALSVAAGPDGVIASALQVMPNVREGVPTLSQLQAEFDTVKKRARQAAMVPLGWSGLEGQLIGMALASIMVPPSANDDDDAIGQDDYEHVLARAQRLVQLGELDRAVEQLNMLKGQTAFTVSDWVAAAKDRIAVDNALNVIRMECAALNASHTG